MATTTTTRQTVVGVFQDRRLAQEAVEELRKAGFREDQIGVAARDVDRSESIEVAADESSKAGEGAVGGMIAGAGVGGLWAIGIAAGLLPAIGPVIAGGLLASIAASAAAGAAAGGMIGALVGLGIPEDEARYYESEFHAGRILVTVRSPERFDEAANILRLNGAEIRGEGMSAVASTTPPHGTASTAGMRPTGLAADEGSAFASRDEAVIERHPTAGPASTAQTGATRPGESSSARNAPGKSC